jgi:hypothetical protein
LIELREYWDIPYEDVSRDHQPECHLNGYLRIYH